MTGIEIARTKGVPGSGAEPRNTRPDRASDGAAASGQARSVSDSTPNSKISLHRHPHQMPPALGSSGSPQGAPERGEQPFDWDWLVPLLIHPAKVAIVEALAWIGQPLSPTEMANLFSDNRDFYLSLISHHVRELAKVGALEMVKTRPVRGATEKFYFFPSR